MKRYDRKPNKKKTITNIIDDSDEREMENIQRETINTLTDEQYQKVIDLFFAKIEAIKINDSELLVKSIENDKIIFNNILPMEDFRELINDPTLIDRGDFLRKFYMYNIDKIIDEAMGKPVNVLQEVPYSFVQSDKNEFIVLYDLLK